MLLSAVFNKKAMPDCVVTYIVLNLKTESVLRGKKLIQILFVKLFGLGPFREVKQLLFACENISRVNFLLGYPEQICQKSKLDNHNGIFCMHFSSCFEWLWAFTSNKRRLNHAHVGPTKWMFLSLKWLISDEAVSLYLRIVCSVNRDAFKLRVMDWILTEVGVACVYHLVCQILTHMIM